MNYRTFLLASLSVFQTFTLAAQTTDANQVTTPYAVVQLGANYQVWQGVSWQTNQLGQITGRTNSYTELATGMHYLQNGQWVDSQEGINLLPSGGAAATNGQHQVYFPEDIYSGVIKVVTPDALVLQEHPLGICYYDGTNSVMIAQLTNSVGQLLPSGNQVIYTNCFSGFAADLVCTYRKSGFECDLVFREAPPQPQSFGLTASATRLELLTEFVNTADPVEQDGIPDAVDGLTDTTLRFGELWMGRGKAFLVGDTGTKAPVYKTWTTLEGRTFLIEELPYWRIASQLQQLPASASSTTTTASANSILDRVSSTRLLPASRWVQASTNNLEMHLARVDFNKRPGVVLDYTTLDGGTNDFTFQGDTTYVISGPVAIGGTTTIEGGTVIKYTTNGIVEPLGPLSCDTAPYRPAILTSINDNSVGDAGTNSTGNPQPGDIEIGLLVCDGSASLQYLRVSYAATGIVGMNCDIWNSQFIDCSNAIDELQTTTTLYNDLFSGCSAVVIQDNGDAMSLDGEQITADNCGSFAANVTAGGLTNSILTAIGGGTNNFILADTVLAGSGSGIYQTVGAGNYYLTNNSPYTNAGMASIDSNLLAQLRQKTTWPPLVYSNVNITANLVLPLHAPRDNNVTPNLGYHYDPLDYVFGGCGIYTNLTITAGTAIGWFGCNGSNLPLACGICLNDGANLTFSGTATAPCWDVPAFMVQEKADTNWVTTGGMVGIVLNGASSNSLPQVNAQFTKWSDQPFNDMLLWDDGAYGVASFSDCEFYGGYFSSYQPSWYLTNCLFFRDFVYYYGQSFDFQNCTFYDGLLCMQRAGWLSYSFWQVRDTTFDGTAFCYSDNFDGSTNHTSFDYNAYNTNNLSWQTYPNPLSWLTLYGTLEVVGAHDVKSSGFNWQSSWFGNYYLPSNSPLIDAGNPTADQVGLFHYTTQTNQTAEGFSPVDIGYHYVATDAYGNPLDTSGNGIPDYLADSNGDGIYDAGDFSDWLDYYNGTLPLLNIISGNNQSGVTNSFLVLPLVVQATGTNTVPLTNAPLTFTTTTGLLATSTNGTPVTNLFLRTGANGYASAYLFLPTNAPVTNYVTVTAQSVTNTVQVTFTELEYTVATPVITPNGGTNVLAPYATITCSTTNAIIHYTVDGNDPTVIDPVATNGQSVWAFSPTLKAKAFLTNGVASATQTASFDSTGTIGAGYRYTLAVKYDGTVWGAGQNNNGQLGNGTTNDQTVLTNVPGLTNVMAVAGGSNYSLALTAGGNVWAWGTNNFGQLGIGNSSQQLSPVLLTNLSGVTAIACGDYNGLALMSNGTVQAWGFNSSGQLGNNSTTSSTTNVLVTNLTSVIAIAGGGSHSLALLSNGTVWAWGYNGYGQLGNNSLTSSHIPVQVTNLTGVVAIAAGLNHSLALQSNGVVWAWGFGGDGNLGYGGTANSHVPVQVTNLTGVAAIAAGLNQSLALLTNGTVQAWGLNTSGQLGDGTTSQRDSSVAVTNLSNVIAIRAGGFHGVALEADGNVVVWGYTNYGLGTAYSKVPLIPQPNVYLNAGAVPPSITVQPTNVASATGNNAVFSVTASGSSPLNYQWYFNTNALAGATNATLSLTDVQTNNAGSYFAVVTNSVGSVTSSNAVLTVLLLPPTITVQPTNETVVVGNNATFSVATSGSFPMSYQWYFDTNTALANATNATLLLTNVQTNQGGTYSVLVSNTVGSAASSNAVLTVNPAPSGMVAWWRAESNYNDSVGDNVAQITNATFGTGEVGEAFVVNGDGERVEMTASSTNEQIGDNLTIEMWIQRANPTNVTFNGGDNFQDAQLADQGWGVYGFGIYGVPENGVNTVNGTLVLGRPGTDGVASSLVLVTNTSWHHVAVTKSGTNVWFYVDGVGQLVNYPQGASPFTFSALDGNSPDDHYDFTIGAFGDNGGSCFWGNIDEVTIYNQVLSSNQIAAIYHAGTAGKLAILTQPTNQTVVLTSNATFTVTVTGSAPSYQWYFNTNTLLVNATNATLSLTDVQATNAGSYFVVVTNSGWAVTSSWAALTILFPPLITSQPTNQTISVSSNATFTVGVTGTSPFSYQWYFNTNTLLVNATNASLTLTNVQFTNAGFYSVIVTNSFGFATSSVVSLTVLAPPAITVQPVSQTIYAGNNAFFSVGATGTSLTYQWQFDGTAIPGATNAVFALLDVQSANNGNYAVVVTNSLGSVTSSNAVLTVPIPPSITTQPTNETGVLYSNVTFSVIAAGVPPPSYQWYFNTNTAIANATNATLNLANLQTNNEGSYSVLATNFMGSVTSCVVYLTLMDTNGLPVDWELEYFGQTGLNTNSDPDGNGATLWQDYTNGWDPTGILPVMSIDDSDNEAITTNTSIALPFTVALSDTNGVWLTHSPLTFGTTAQLSTCFGSSLVTNLSLRTDNDGEATVWLYIPTNTLVTNSVTVTAVNGTNSEQIYLETWAVAPADNYYEVMYTSTMPPSAPDAPAPAAMLYWTNYEAMPEQINYNGLTQQPQVVQQYGSNLWLAITDVTNSTAYLMLSNTTADVLYEIQSRSNLLSTQWVSEGFANGSELTNWTAMYVAQNSRSNLFLRIRSWVDSTGTGIPDWWWLQYFGQTTNVNAYAANSAGDGYSNLQKFQMGLNPTNYYTTNAPGGFFGSLDATGTNVVLGWTDMPGPVVNYMIQRGILNTNTSLYSYSQIGLVSSNAVFFRDVGAISNANSQNNIYNLTAVYPGSNLSGTDTWQVSSYVDFGYYGLPYGPPLPGNFNANTDITETNVLLSWTQAQGATNYIIEHGVLDTNTDNYDYYQFAVVGSNTTSLELTGAITNENNWNDEYEVLAVFPGDGLSQPASSYINIGSATGPAAPTNCYGYTDSTGTNYFITWSPASGAVSNYIIIGVVYDDITGDQSYPQIGEVSSNTTSFEVVGELDEYGNPVYDYFYVVAVYAGGSLSQAATPGSPAAPTKLDAYWDSTGTNVMLSWIPVAGGITGYLIQRNDDDYGYYQIGQVGTNDTSFENTNALHSYGFDLTFTTYEVQAIYPNGGLSEPVTAIVSNTPPAPSGLSGMIETNGTNVLISWSPALGPVSNYDILLGVYNPTNGSYGYSQIGAVGSNTTSFQATGVISNNNSYNDVVEVEASDSGAYLSTPDYYDFNQFQTTQTYNINITAQMVRNQTGSWQLMFSSIPTNVQTIASYWYGYDYNIDSLYDSVAAGNVDGAFYVAGTSEEVDIPVSSITNGIYIMPDWQTTNLFGSGVFGYVPMIQPVGTNNERGKLFQAGYLPNDAPCFVDGRQHLWQNLLFGLRAATISRQCDFLYEGISGEGDVFTFNIPTDTNYVESSFFHPSEEFKVYSAYFQPFLKMDDLWPFTANYELHQNLYDPSYTGPANFVWSNILTIVPAPAVLGVSDPYWIQQGFNGLSNPSDLAASTNGGVFSLARGAANLFGLSFEAALVNQGPFITVAPGNSTSMANVSTFFSQTVDPSLQLVNYYFAPVQTPGTSMPGINTNQPYSLPSNPGFANTNQTPLMIASVGNPFLIGGWEKFSIENGYSSKYAYLGQYFVTNAFVVTNGIVTTNTTGVVSPYGNFFPTDPGVIEMITMLDTNTDAQGTGIVRVVSLNVDANHDGTMNFTYGGPDFVSANNPFRFWVNDDQDSGDDGGNGGVPGLTASQQADGYNYGTDDDGNPIYQVHGARDLVDFFPVYIDIGSLFQSNALSAGISVTDTNYQFMLSQADGVLRFAYTDLTPTNYMNFLRDTNEARTLGGLPGLPGVPGEAGGAQLTTISNATSGGVALPQSFIAGIATNNQGIILVEAAAPTAQPLVLSIYHGTNLLAQTSLCLSISGVEQMFRSKTMLLNPQSGTVPDRLTDASVPNEPNTTDANFIFLHGYNVNPTQARGWDADIYKRLYWSGSHAKFYGVTWEAADSQKENQVTINLQTNIVNAFNTAPLLNTFLNSLSGTNIVAAHSLGNMVVLSTLNDYSNRSINAYFMIDAAVAMEAIDSSASLNPDMYPSAWTNYENRLWASKWLNLWPTNDGRNTLTWSGRLSNLQNASVYNFYSTGEEVLRDYPTDPPNNLIGIAFGQLVSLWEGDTGEYTWAWQEKLKGLMPANGLLSSDHGGWQFNEAYETNVVTEAGSYWEPMSPAAADSLTNAQLQTNAFFNFSSPIGSFFPFTNDLALESSSGSSYAQTNQNRILSDAIPCLTLPVGANYDTNLDLTFGDTRNYDMQLNYENGWPVDRGPAIYPAGTTATGEWHHSDIRAVAYTFTYKLFNQMVTLGNLQ